MSEVANRVLKNSRYLYFSMGLSMFVSLYSTRLILNALGSSDFGIFCIIGGAIGMLGFLNAAMSTTTQRFINYAEGEGKPEKQKSIFTVSISIHFLLSLLMVIIFEIAYFFFFDGILNIPSDRIPSAKWIYQLMLLSTVLTIQTVPYNAIINAHENMRYLSIIGVFQTLMKLVIALIVVHVYTDKLILYGILTTFVSLIFMIILQIYCHRNYSECTYSIHKYHNKELMKEMTSFAGWGFINSSSSMFAQYGMGIVLNSFFGTILSAAQGVANQISGQLMVFSRTMLMAINPIIGKKAGSNDITNMMRISLFSSKMSFLIIAFFAFPFIIETPYILQLWLKNVPEWSVCFFRFEITRNMLDQLTITLTSAINAEGRIKYYSILRGCSYFLPLPISLFLFHLGFSPYWFYIIWIFTWNGIGSLIILYYAHKNCGMQYADFFKIIIYPTVELRKSNDSYTKDIKNLNWHGHKINSNNVVFQQKGLSVNTPEAHQTYCRIIIDIQKGSLGEYPKFSDYEDLTIEDIHTFQELAKQNSYEYKILGQPEVRWIKIEDTYGIEVEYVRNGANNSRTHVCNYYFFNDNLFATIILSYRQDDIRKWETDFSNIIKTFKWNNKK